MRYTNFSRSWKDDVRKPRDGKPCLHERHAQNCLRAVLHKIEFFRLKDVTGEGFVFAGLKWFAVKDIETGKPYEIRIIKACFAWAYSVGIIRRARRIRSGVLREGFTVTDHSMMSKIAGSRCVFCSANDTADDTIDDTIGDTIGDTIDDTMKGSLTTPLATPSNGGQSVLNDGLAENCDETLPSVVHSLESLVTSESLRVSRVSATRTDLISSDLTARQSVKVSRLGALGFEQLLDALTDQEFQTTAVEHYKNRDALKRVVYETVKELGDTTLNDRKDCKRICEHVNAALLKDGIKPPGGWVPTLKALKSGGPLQHKLPVIPPTTQERQSVNPKAYLSDAEKQAIEQKNLEAMRAAGFAV